jgi:hypothetical protein
MLSNNQQKIINSLISEFDRINQQANDKEGFNLIDVRTLVDKSKRINEWNEMKKADTLAWRKAANEECYRIIELLKDDMPEVYIEKCERTDARIIICKRKEDVGFSDRIVTLDIRISNKTMLDEYKNCYVFGEYLTYKPSPTELDAYSSCYRNLQGAISDKRFLDALRTRIL